MTRKNYMGSWILVTNHYNIIMSNHRYGEVLYVHVTQVLTYISTSYRGI